MTFPVATIGFKNHSAERFFEKLRTAGVKLLLDVRLRNVCNLFGFANKKHLPYLLQEILEVDYVHEPLLAPTDDLLDAFRSKKLVWNEYEREFNALMQERRIEDKIDPKLLVDACLLCACDKPHMCHRRLVAEHLSRHWGNVLVKHL